MKYNYLISDVDGILTDGGHFYNACGKQYKKFGSNDKDALRILNEKYFDKILFVTNDEVGFDISKKRIDEMGFEVNCFNAKDRAQFLSSLKGNNIYVGDGIQDAELFKHFALSFALEDSTPQAKENCSYVLPTKAGKNVFSHLLYFLDNDERNDLNDMIFNILSLKEIDKEIESFCDSIVKCYNGHNKIVFCGVGKNALLSELISEFLHPFNIVSVFLDPHRAVHGNLGILKENDILIVSSKSGNTTELIHMMDCLENKTKEKNYTLYKFLLTSSEKCELNNFNFKEHLYLNNIEEISYLGFSPQTTILKYLIVFFVLVNKLARQEKIAKVDYLLNHQGGEIGKNTGHKNV